MLQRFSNNQIFSDVNIKAYTNYISENPDCTFNVPFDRLRRNRFNFNLSMSAHISPLSSGIGIFAEPVIRHSLMTRRDPNLFCMSHNQNNDSPPIEPSERSRIYDPF